MFRGAASPARPRVALGRAPLRRSSLKSIRRIDLPGFAGRSSSRAATEGGHQI